MFRVTKEEARQIRSVFPNEHIAVTGRKKKSSRKKYYACESIRVKKLLGRTKEYKQDE